MAKILHRSFRGEDVDLEQLLMNQGESVALGNAGLNARGDLVDTKGRIVKTAEQIDKEYKIAVQEEKRTGKNNKKFSISGNYQQIESFITPEQIHQQLQDLRASQEHATQEKDEESNPPVLNIEDVQDIQELSNIDTQTNRKRKQ